MSAPVGGVPGNAVEVLAEHHRRLRSAFEAFEALPGTAYVARSKLAAQMIGMITTQAYLEREVLYPRLGSLVPEASSEIEELAADHAGAEQVAGELWTMRPEDPRFASRVADLIRHVRAQLHARETSWFPRLVAALEPAVLDDLGTELVRARRRAPSSPRLGS